MNTERHDEVAPKAWCKIGQSMCADDCAHCVPWLMVCDGCSDYGHCDSEAWTGDFSTNPPLVYCDDCAVDRGLKK